MCASRGRCFRSYDAVSDALLQKAQSAACAISPGNYSHGGWLEMESGAGCRRAAMAESTADEWSETSDAELVQLYQSTRADIAFEHLVKRYQVRLYRLLLGMVRSPSLAEELLQRSLVKAAIAIDQLEDGQAFYAWVIAIARGQALDELRAPRHNRRDSLEPKYHEEASDSEFVEQQAVRDILEQMGPEDALALVLSDLQGASTKELAIALQVGVSAAKMRLKRARERFRTLYREQSQ